MLHTLYGHESSLCGIVTQWLVCHDILRNHFRVEDHDIICFCNEWHWTSAIIYDAYVIVCNRNKIIACHPNFFGFLAEALMMTHNELIRLARWAGNRMDLDGLIHYKS